MVTAHSTYVVSRKFWVDAVVVEGGHNLPAQNRLELLALDGAAGVTRQEPTVIVAMPHPHDGVFANGQEHLQ